MDLPEPDDRLNSWKEIAAFLGRTVRTVQRWEKEDGLPLRRGGPGRRGAVTASKREISEWWERRRGLLDDEVVALPVTSTGLWRRWLAAAAVSAMLVVLAAVGGHEWLRPRQHPSPPDASRWGRLFAAATAEGRTASFIPLGAVPAWLALSPSSDRAYVALRDQVAVAVVDLGTGRIAGRLKGVERPVKLFVSRGGERLYVVGMTEVAVHDLTTRMLTTSFVGGGTIRDASLSSDERDMWLTLAQGGLKILDIGSGRLETLPTVGCPMYMAAAARSHRLFLSYQCGGPGGRDGHDAIEVMDEVRRTRIATRAGLPLVGSFLAVSPDEQHVWTDAGDACADRDYDHSGCPRGTGPVLHALRADTLDPLLTVRLPGETFGAYPRFFPDGTRLVVVDRGFTVIDRGSGAATEAVKIAPGPGEFTADGRVFVAADPRGRGLRIFERSRAPDPVVLRAAATHWSADGTANDIVGGTHAVSRDGFGFAPGVDGQAFLFDAASTGVDFGRRLEVDIATDHDVTYAAWIKPRRTDVPLHIASHSGHIGWRWWISDDGRMAFCFLEAIPQASCDAAAVAGPAPLQPERWFHVAVVRTASALSLFLDGREIATRSLAGVPFPIPTPSETPNLRLGAGVNGSAPFQGLIDEVVLFRRALSAGALADLRRATSLDPR